MPGKQPNQKTGQNRVMPTKIRRFWYGLCLVYFTVQTACLSGIDRTPARRSQAYLADDEATFSQQCAALGKSLTLPSTTVWFATYIPAGSTVDLSEDDVSCDRPPQLVASVDLCRVAMQVRTSNQSAVSFEAWLPRNWAGRFLMTGNSGLEGCIAYQNMEYGSSLGFATVGSNNGHNGTSAISFLNNPDVVTDFSWRSVHTSVVLGKQVSAAFYGREHDKSYYLGCSTGGRQGFKEAQSFPEDFDGIVAGAPAISFNGLISWGNSFFIRTGPPGSPGFVTPAQWAVVQDDVLAQCDGIDGHVDGIIEDPRLCDYRPEGLLCGEGKAATAACLTGEQAATVRAVFSPLYGEDGWLVYPRLPPGPDPSKLEIYCSGKPFQYSVEWFRYAIYNNVSWDPATFAPADSTAAAARNPSNIETWDGDLSGVRSRGSKILHYHGLADAMISSENSNRYYDHVVRTMGLSGQEMDAFYRFFRISGMGHCEGGNGAALVGGHAANVATLEPEGNVLTAMVRWVEEGTAPDTILGTAMGTDGKIKFQRRHCKYPLRNVYKGEKDPNDPNSWQCVV